MKYMQCIDWTFRYILTVKTHFHFKNIQIHNPVSYPLCSHCNRDVNYVCLSVKLSIKNTVFSCILQSSFSRNKPSISDHQLLCMDTSCHFMCIWYATFRDNLVVSYSRIEILRNIEIRNNANILDYKEARQLFYLTAKTLFV